jgi:hypothetical protein
MKLPIDKMKEEEMGTVDPFSRETFYRIRSINVRLVKVGFVAVWVRRCL